MTETVLTVKRYALQKQIQTKRQLTHGYVKKYNHCISDQRNMHGMAYVTSNKYGITNTKDYVFL